MVNISIADMPYHFGIKLNAHPTKKQKDIVNKNNKVYIKV